ncbi:MAG: bifunctional metallophosphatase/5'-nucleotidase [Candidatus Marinimicrobia bacterium]|nr:bifunctional metallophosphatase/5'-nucleotidase [Candidatus Neomarinimicrobiota bacterium]
MKYFNLIMFTLILFFSSCGKQSADITILHWNDFHSHNIPWVPTRYNEAQHTVGGYALLDAYLDSLEIVFPGALRVNAGDDFQGSPVCAVTKGISQIEILNAVEPDFFTIGNHEFDYSWKYLDSLRQHLADFPMYAANLINVETDESAVPGCKIFHQNGYRFALIGLTHPQMNFLTIPENMEGVRVADPAKTAQNIIDRLKKRGIQCFIVVTHIGIEGDRELAKAVPEIDLIIGGHSHTYMREAEQVNGVWIVQASAHGRYVGLTRFHIDQGNITSLKMEYVETVAGRLKPSQDIAEIVMSYEAGLADKMNEVIGELKIPWIRSGGESNIGNWIADAFLDAVDADIAIMNNGGIRKNLAVGSILVRDIWEIAPFGNTLVTYEWTGKEILEGLDNMVQKHRSLQFSGITMVLDREKGLIDARVNGKSIDPEKIYTVVTNNYTASQANNYFGLTVDSTVETGFIDRDVLIKAVRKNPIIISEIEGRIVYR